MLFGHHCLLFRPREQFVRRNEPIAHFPRLFGDDVDALFQLFRMGQEKIQIEAAGCIEDLNGLFKMRSFLGIGSSLLSW